MSLLLKNCLIVDPAQNIIKEVLDIYIEGGIIKDLKKNIKTKAEQIIDLEGKIVAPGFIDMHVHLREPGYEEKETIKTGSKAAAAGGFTSIACMANTNPVADDVAIIKHIREVAERNGIVNVLPIGACTVGLKGEHMTQIGEMQRFGAVAFSDDGMPIANAQVMRKILEYTNMFKAIVISHCEDIALVNGGSMNEGFISTKLGNHFGRVHIAHISTKESVEVIRQAKRNGAPITCETAPHYLTLTEDAVSGYNTNAKMSPPLRKEQDRLALIDGLKDGTIDMIATDHAPHTQDNKRVEFNLAANGIVGLETAVPLIYTRLVKTGLISIERMVEAMSTTPSKVFSLGKGTLAVGAPADITIIDPALTKKVDKTKFYSKGKNTPFDGWELSGWPCMTIVKGVIKFTAEQGILA